MGYHRARRTGLLDGIVFSGVEPLLQRGLPRAVRVFRALGLEVGLHTGGTGSPNWALPPRTANPCAEPPAARTAGGANRRAPDPGGRASPDRPSALPCALSEPGPVGQAGGGHINRAGG
ncbi:hypothetical protein ACWGDE_13195 [Streptomyces sp. NPDC054956]